MSRSGLVFLPLSPSPPPSIHPSFPPSSPSPRRAPSSLELQEKPASQAAAREKTARYFLRCRIFDRMRRFLRPTLRRPLPDFLVPTLTPVEWTKQTRGIKNDESRRHSGESANSEYSKIDAGSARGLGGDACGVFCVLFGVCQEKSETLRISNPRLFPTCLNLLVGRLCVTGEAGASVLGVSTGQFACDGGSGWLPYLCWTGLGTFSEIDLETNIFSPRHSGKSDS